MSGGLPHECLLLEIVLYTVELTLIIVLYVRLSSFRCDSQMFTVCQCVSVCMPLYGIVCVCVYVHAREWFCVYQYSNCMAICV